MEFEPRPEKDLSWENLEKASRQRGARAEAGSRGGVSAGAPDAKAADRHRRGNQITGGVSRQDVGISFFMGGF